MSTATEPLRTALLDEARADTERALGDADERAAAIVARAETEGRALVDHARAEGLAAAALAGAHEQAQAHRQARALVLAAQRELCEGLRRDALAAAQRLRTDPRYPALVERLAALARAQLGAHAVVELDPDDGGGVRAHAGDRHVDYTLDALVERSLASLGSEIEGLWR